MENGTISKEQAAALMAKKGQPGFSPLSALTEILKSKGVITAGEADRVAKKAAAAPQAAVTLRYEPSQKELENMAQNVTDEIKKDVRGQVKEEIKQEVLEETKKEIQAAAAPEWTKRIRFGGDMRLRYEGDYFNQNNGDFLSPSNPTQILNSQTERDRFRVRARLGADGRYDRQLEAGVRFSTGDTINPVTSQQTMGNYFNKYSVVMDLAYLKFTPRPASPSSAGGSPTRGSLPISSGGATSPLTDSRSTYQQSSPIPSSPSSPSGPSPSRRWSSPRRTSTSSRGRPASISSPERTCPERSGWPSTTM